MGYFVQGMAPAGFPFRCLASTFRGSPTTLLDLCPAIMRLRTTVLVRILICGLLFVVRPGVALAQAGPSIVAAVGSGLGVEGGSGAFVLAASLGLSDRSSVRPGVTLTAGRVLGSVEATFDLERDVSVFVPYLVVGGGALFGGSESVAAGVWGGGLRGRINARTSLLIEGRGFWVDEARAPGGALTIGLRWSL